MTKIFALFLLFLALVKAQTPEPFDCQALQRETETSGRCSQQTNINCSDLCTGKGIPLADCRQAAHCCVINNNCILKILNRRPLARLDLSSSIAKWEEMYPEEVKIKRRNLILNPPSRFPPIGTPFPTCYGGSTPIPSGGFPVILGFPGGAPPPPSLGIPFVPPSGNPFSLGGNPFNPYGPNPGIPYASPPLFCPKFPNNCEPICDQRSFACPVDIPYCHRIPCSPQNPVVEHDPDSCLQQQGCWFDFELRQWKDELGEAALSGVPVCHQAINNVAFHKRAAEYIQRYGAWNPLLTNCLINEYKSEIFRNSPGCYMIGVLEHFGHCAKRAGWASITENECYLIGGCWRNGMCYYPLRIDGVKVRSSRDELLIQNDPRFLYGLPDCLPITSNAPGAEFLSNYHKCLAIGCAVNVDRNTYWQNLYQVGSCLPPYLLPIYWGMIQSGKVRPDNYQNIIQQILNQYTRPQQNFPNLSGFCSFPGFNPLSLDLNNNDNSAKPRNLIFPPSISGGIPGFTPNLGGAIPGFTPNLGGGIPGFPSHIPCPYTKPRHPYLPLLRGKIDGCCEKPFCYIPREQLRTQYSGVSGYLTEWSEFEKCSVTCGGSTQKRTRECIGGNCNPNLKTEQIRRCNEKCCPSYGRWRNWSQCSATCGDGVQTRTRRCTCCDESADETRSCKICDCPAYEYTPWSDCDADCCDGLRRRTKRCSNQGTCPNAANLCHPQEETETCTVYCGSVTYSPRPTCDRSICRWRYDPECRRSDGSTGCCPPGQMRPRYLQQACCFNG